MSLVTKQQQVVPYVMVPNGPVFIQFMQMTFRAEVGPIMQSADGKKIVHGELQIGESVLFFADGTDEAVEYDNSCQADEQAEGTRSCAKEPSNIHIHVFVDDALEVVRRAEEAGGTSVIPIMEDESGHMGGFVDPFNNLWWVKSFK